MPYLWPMVNVGSNLILLVLTGLSIAAASSRARGHLSWLIPMALAWFFHVCSGLCGVAYLAALQRGGFSNNPVSWIMVPEGILSTLGILCLLGSGVALLIRMQATPPTPPTVVSRSEESWPPAPTTPQDRG